MPRTPEANEQIRTAAKEKIRSAAIDVFVKKGFHSSSIEDVAKSAGISKGLLYNYFKGKTDLLAELVQNRIDEIRSVMEAAIELPSPKEQLQFIADHSLRNVAERPEAYRFYLHLQTHPKEDEVVSHYSQLLKDEMLRQSKVQIEIFRKLHAKHPELESLCFSTALHGIMFMYSSYPNGIPLEELKRELVTSYIERYL